VQDPEYFHRAMKEITDRIVHDIFSPPVASRIYVYATVAGYETIIHQDKNYKSLAGQLHGLKNSLNLTPLSNIVTRWRLQKRCLRLVAH